MDATKRPLKIPPVFATYAEQHGIFDMYKVCTIFLFTMHRNPTPAESDAYYDGVDL